MNITSFQPVQKSVINSSSRFLFFILSDCMAHTGRNNSLFLNLLSSEVGSLRVEKHSVTAFFETIELETAVWSCSSSALIVQSNTIYDHTVLFFIIFKFHMNDSKALSMSLYISFASG